MEMMKEELFNEFLENVVENYFKGVSVEDALRQAFEILVDKLDLRG